MGAAYLAFAARVAIGLRKSNRGLLLLAALTATGLWAALVVPLVLGLDVVVATDIANALRYALWIAFMAHLIVRPSQAASGTRWPWSVTAVIMAIAVASVVLGGGLPIRRSLGLGIRMAYGLQLALPIVGLIFVEQMLRRIAPQHRWGVKPLAIALASVFGFDLYLYADAMLFGYLDADLWVARGFANLIVIPFIGVATARTSAWTIDLHISRKAIFHSTTLLLSGVFLLMVAGAGYLVRYLGGEWGRALAIELVFVGAIALALVAASGHFRSRVKVFVSKHFFSYRYDYREEWLRFTHTLASESTLPRVQERVVAALADLVESPAGALWLRDDIRGYTVAGRWNVPPIDVVEPPAGSLVSFLERTGWIVSIPEWRRHRERYGTLELPASFDLLASPWLVVPLSSGAHLLGFVVLVEPRTPIDVDWEVRDLLKVASRQAASYLGEIVASDALLEARKFDAFNRMSAFVVHDLKNVVAQLSLMLKNAERHRDNPRFQADMLETVKHAVDRVHKLMLQLRTGAEPVENAAPVDVSSLVARVCSAKADAHATIRCDARGTFLALGHEDRLHHVIGHLVQNAIDASPANGEIRVVVDGDERQVSVSVEDEGSGMTPEFVRDRLFRPFQTTKATGMGIGVYESVQYLSRIGGDVQVESALGTGTRVRVRLPRIAERQAHESVAENLA
jgi:putative PEP-CTERM system histidine kinase